MSVEIWKGMCRGAYDTKVSLFPTQGQVWIDQEGGGCNDTVCMDESEAIDIALCILAELAPGMFYNLKKDD